MSKADWGLKVKLLLLDANYSKNLRGALMLDFPLALGAALGRTLGRFDGVFFASDWESALNQLLRFREGEPLEELQVWSHGKWGEVRLGRDAFGLEELRSGSRRTALLRTLGKRFVQDGLLWLRCCETFGSIRGKCFARGLAETLGVRVAGHTFVIHAWQSGLHSIRPGAEPGWSDDEGILAGTPASPRAGRRSGPLERNTIAALQMRAPSGW